MKATLYSILLLLVAASLLAGCAGARRTVYLDPQFDFGGVTRVAIVPFENLTNDQGTSRFVTRLFFTELLAQKVFDVVEPGEVSAFLATKPADKGAELSVDIMKAMAAKLNVQGIIFGSVGESAEFRSGNLNTNVISLNVRMVSPETGATIWSSSVSTEGPGFFSRLFGLGEKSRGTVTRGAVRKAIRSLVQ
jgi:TolB-like protein